MRPLQPMADPSTPGAPGSTSIPEFTGRAVAAGILFGVLFGAANAYLGLRVGMTVSTSIPVAVMTVALFRALGTRISLLEANLAQTMGSASTALATGCIFTLPALFLWGLSPPYLQIVLLALLGGVLGISAMIPLRELLIVRAEKELPYPEGRACAEVLRATDQGSSGGAWIFYGLFAGAAVKLVLELTGVAPREISVALPGLPNAELAMEIAPALIAVGFILGIRQAGIVVSGSIISSLVLIPLISLVGANLPSPLYPETVRRISSMDAGDIWSRYVRYIGAGAVAAAGLVTVAGALPSMARSFLAVAQGLRGGARPSGARDVPGWVVATGVGLVVGVTTFVPFVLGGELSLGQRALCGAGVGVLGICFVAVTSRIAGLVGVSSQPTSGITLVTLLAIGGVFAALGWTSSAAKAGVLAVGAIVAIAASQAGDISQDLKTGHLVGATPSRQQVAQFIGAGTACWAVAATLLFLGKAYTFGSTELPAPQAMLMKTIIEGVLNGSLPWPLVLSGAGLSAAAMLMGVSGLAFAIGVYLPLAAMAPLFVGGVVRWLADRSRGAGAGTPDEEDGGPGVLAASGLVAGEGLAGVVVAVLVGGFHLGRPSTPLLGGAGGTAFALAVVVAICAMLYRAGRTYAAKGL